MFLGKVVEVGVSARMKLKSGVDKTVDPVKSTLGPFGTAGLIEKGLRITKDGMKIAQEITLDDEIEDLACRKVKEAMAAANDKVGDSSTTTATLIQAVVKESTRLLGTDKTIGGRISTADFLSKVNKECDEITSKLLESATPIETEDQLIKSAIVSVEDEKLGELIGSTQFKLGKEGYILAEEVPERETTVEFVQGIKFDNGFGASYLINNQEKQMLEDTDVRTILTNHTLQTLEPLKPVLDQLIKQKVTKVAVIARGFTDQAIKDCAANIQAGFKIYPINAPYTDSKEIMLDLASVLGGQFMDNEMHELEDMQVSDVGFASKIRAKRYEAIITGKNDVQHEKVQARITKLKEQLAGSVSDFESRMLKSRLAQLESGFAIIKVGGQNETERKRVFDKVEDAVNAVRTAYAGGTVKGGGIAFKEIADEMPDDSILKRPLYAINEQLLANAPADFVIEDWVRDPAKGLCIALEQAVSCASELATASVAIHSKRDRGCKNCNEDSV